MKALKVKPKPVFDQSLSLVDKVEMNLREYFTEANLQPGDAIPKEAELAESMGVSRTALREALSRLRTLGLIESKRNRGIILTQPDILGSFERVLNPMLLDSATLQDIFELRLVLEMGIADLLFIRKTDESIRKLASLVEKEENTKDRFLKNRYDAEFHSMLYEISGNQTLLRFQKMLHPIFNFVHSGQIIGKTEVKNAVKHRDLLNELKEGTPSSFREKMSIHLKVYFDNVDE
ncbi:DNA-binding transcriptional regulator, FadR family [Cyclobacterium lianum]|uniref:DNA-binding transcriptional regulator, FadR family n=1 Tax=Cyclobacterium lianum TaxID=388280 RepID=A0A1M7JLK5_9BACT|nr:GntR family transcriptional regulator [Cyclobacterium lianum]SHM53791.1 DNA-binding transcriptional regulator, FadR family [Cyclobacterium lianum]